MFSKLTSYLNSLKAEYSIPFCELAVYQNHKPVYRHCTNSQPNSYWIYSISKISTMVAALQLVEQGKIGLNDPVEKYLPEYANLMVQDGRKVRPVNTTLTIRHLLTMTSGMNYDLHAPPVLDSIAKGDSSVRDLVKRMAEMPLLFEPGASYFYSLSFDVLSAIIEVVSDLSLPEYFQKNIYDPLDMHSTGFENRSSLPFFRQHTYNAETNRLIPAEGNEYIFAQGYASGGAGVISTVDDQILLADALACMGEGANGARILQPETVKKLATPQLNQVQLGAFHDTNSSSLKNYSWGLGVRTRIIADKPSHKGEFGWQGAAGCYMLSNPNNGISIFYGEGVLCQEQNYDIIHPTIRDIVYSILDKS